MTTVNLIVRGTPQPKGSKKGYIRPGVDHVVIVEANPNAKPWMERIAQAVADQYGGPLLDGALELEVHFYRPRNKGDYGTGKNAGLLKDSAPVYPAVSPDIDKLSRGVLDGLTGQLFRNDSQVVRKWAEKHYGAPARAEIRVTVLPHQTIGEESGADQLQITA